MVSKKKLASGFGESDTLVMANNTATRKLEITIKTDRFLARVYWMANGEWKLVARATFKKFPVILCERLNNDYTSNGWILETKGGL